MASDTVYRYLTQSQLITGSTTISVGAFNGTGEVASCGSAFHSNYLLADAVLFASFSAAVNSASNWVNLYRRDLNISGTNDAPVPTANAPAYSAIHCGAFSIPPFTAASSGYFPLPDVPMSKECEFYIENATNVAIVSSFTVKFTPKTFGSI